MIHRLFPELLLTWSESNMVECFNFQEDIPGYLQSTKRLAVLKMGGITLADRKEHIRHLESISSGVIFGIIK